MKRILIFIWTALLIVILFFFLRYLIVGPKDNHIKSSAFIEKSTEIFSRKNIDSLLANNKYLLLTIGYSDCALCDSFRSDIIPEKFSLGRYYIDATYDNENMLVLQSLYFTGFPLSYVMDQDYNILGVIEGKARFEERLNSVIYEKSQLLPDSIPGISRENTLLMLRDSFRSLMAYLDDDKNGMKYHAEASLTHGNYFFNAYLMYKYYEYKENTDSMAYFKSNILSDIDNINIFVYHNLLTELGQDSSLLMHAHTHTHDH